jgi:ankyrin repeat protein
MAFRKKTAMELALEAEEEEERAGIVRAKDDKAKKEKGRLIAIAKQQKQKEMEEFDAMAHARSQREKEGYDFHRKLVHLKERLWSAVEHGDDDAVFLVIRHAEKDEQVESIKGLIDTTTDDGVSPLYKACRNGHVECSRLLIDAGASAGRATKAAKLTPLFAAATKGSHACIDLLLKQPDVRADYRTADGRTAMYAAAEANSARCVQQLIDAGANADLRRNDGSTPLIVAAYMGNLDAVETLLAAGARLKLRDEDGTALQNAQRQKQDACVLLLQKAEKERGALEDNQDLAQDDQVMTPSW